jgi:hypothetical protein
LGCIQTHQPVTAATLDTDATLIETHKRDALPCYKEFKACQPLNCWWAEQGAILYSEFRDGNVPAGHEQLRVLQASLAHLPASVTTVSLRSDTAGYHEELLLYCCEGKDPRFGVIDFAIGADVAEAFRAAVRATAESEWKPLIRMFDGKPQETDQEWAEVCYVPNWAGDSRKQADYRFLAIREPLRQLPLGDQAQLPFPTQDFGQKGTYKLFGVVTNRKDAGDQVICWLRERCGKSEEVHSVMKTDLSGGQLPSGLFGAQHVHVAGAQGWLDIQIVVAPIFLKLAGGDCVEDLERMETDSGFAAVLRAIERDVLSSAERRLLKKRWRRSRRRTVASPAGASAWLERLHDPAAPKAAAGTAVIVEVTKQLRGLWQANQTLLGCIQRHQPATSATLDMDATLVETHKRDASTATKGSGMPLQRRLL